MGKVIVLLSMIGMLGLAWGLDGQVLILRQTPVGERGVFIYWWMVVINLIIALAWLAFIWLTIMKIKRDWPLSLACLLAGVFLTIIFPLQLSLPQLGDYVLYYVARSFRATYISFGLTSRFALTSAFMAVIGFYRLIDYFVKKSQPGRSNNSTLNE
jgi:hypothetical protein